MSSFFTLLAGMFTSLASELPGKILASLGIGWLTFEATTAALDTVVAHYNSSISSVSGAVLQIINMGGFTTSASIIISALTVRLAMESIPKLGKL